MMFLSPYPRLVIESISFDGFLHVVLMGAKVKMIWTRTLWVVTTMKNMLLWWYRAIVHLVRESMRRNESVVYPELSVSENCLRTMPFPTIISLFNLAPKLACGISPSMMSMNKTFRLTFNPSESFIILVSNRSRIAATALA